MKENIQIEKGCLLRQTIKSDLEKPKNSVTDGHHLPSPSAVLEIKLSLTDKKHNSYFSSVIRRHLKYEPCLVGPKPLVEFFDFKSPLRYAFHS